MLDGQGVRSHLEDGQLTGCAGHRGFAATAVEQQELPASEDPDRLTFELYGIMVAADTNFVLHDDPRS